MNKPHHIGGLLPLIVAAIAMILGLILLGVMLFNAQVLVQFGLTGHVWYVLLLPLGIAAALTTFSLFKSYAQYSGKVLNGTLEIGGPIVVVVLVLVLGFYFVPSPKQRFDLTLFLHGESGRSHIPLRNQGYVSLDLAADRRTEAIGKKGEARFIGIPADMRGRLVNITLDSMEYELKELTTIELNQEVVYLSVQAKLINLLGEVSDEHNRPLSQARVSIAGLSTNTDIDGRFKLVLPADLPKSDSRITITARGYEPWRGQVTLGANPLSVRLSAITQTN